MVQKYPIYKGLQRPLVFRGFKGKYIAWGIASLIAGLLIGGTIGSLINMYIGGLLTIIFLVGGLILTFLRQQKGLYSKGRQRGIFIHSYNLVIKKK